MGTAVNARPMLEYTTMLEYIQVQHIEYIIPAADPRIASWGINAVNAPSPPILSPLFTLFFLPSVPFSSFPSTY